MRLLAGLAAMAGLCGCLSVGERLDAQAARVALGDYDAAYRDAASAAEKGGVDAPFWSAEAGALALMRGEPEAAIGHLDAADNGFNDVARRRYGASAADTAAALAANDCLLPYAPEGLDRVFANLYKALAYGAAGDAAAMRVELNRARQRQYEWFYRCSEDIAEATPADLSPSEAKWVRQQADKAAQAAEPLSAAVAEAASAEGAEVARLFGNLRGFGNAYAAHVAGVARWCAGDSPRNDLAMAAALAPGNAAAQADLAAERRGERPHARVWVYVEDGLAPRRTEVSMSLPYPSLAGRFNGIGTLSFAVPRLETRPAAAAGYAANGVALRPLADVEALARDQFARAWPGILARQIARTLLRLAAQEGGQAVLHNATDNEFAPLLYSLAMIAWDAGTNAADLRCADLLPKTVWMGAVARPADGVVRVAPAGGREIAVRLKGAGNALVWVRRPSAAAPATVMSIDLDKE